jgi:hypothetical protein
MEVRPHHFLDVTNKTFKFCLKYEREKRHAPENISFCLPVWIIGIAISREHLDFY